MAEKGVRANDPGGEQPTRHHGTHALKLSAHDGGEMTTKAVADHSDARSQVLCESLRRIVDMAP